MTFDLRTGGGHGGEREAQRKWQISEGEEPRIY